MLGLCCCTGFSLVVASRGYFLGVLRRPLSAVASLVVEHGLYSTGLSSCGAWAQMPLGMWDLSFWTKDQTPVSCIDRWILNHQTTMEFPRTTGFEIKCYYLLAV